MKKTGILSVVCMAAMLLMAACGGKDTEDLIVGTWELASVTYQSTGHPDQSLNSFNTTLFEEGSESMTLTFGKDGNGYRVDPWYVDDSIYVYYGETIVGGYDTSYYVYDTTPFSYFASGNSLNMQERGTMKAYRIDQLDKEILSYTDTNAYNDVYINDYGRSMQFTQEIKTVTTLRRRR